MVAVSVGALMPEPFSSLSASWLVGLQAGWVAPAWHRRLALAADLSFAMPDSSGDLQSMSAASGVAWHAALREVSIGISFELRQPIGRFTPYLRAGPRLLIVDALVGAHSDGDATRLPSSRENSLALGLQLVPGVGFALPAGQLFVELPVLLLWRVGSTPQLTGDFNPSAICLAAGYRVFF